MEYNKCLVQHRLALACPQYSRNVEEQFFLFFPGGVERFSDHRASFQYRSVYTHRPPDLRFRMLESISNNTKKFTRRQSRIKSPRRHHQIQKRKKRQKAQLECAGERMLYKSSREKETKLYIARSSSVCVDQCKYMQKWMAAWFGKYRHQRARLVIRFNFCSHSNWCSQIELENNGDFLKINVVLFVHYNAT